MDTQELLESIKQKRREQGIGEHTTNVRDRFSAWAETECGKELCRKVTRWHAQAIFAAGANWGIESRDTVEE